MKNHTAIITKKIKFFLGALFCLGVVWGTVFAQEGLERARNSNLTGVALPANAQRVASASVPAEVAQTFDKIIAAGNGKFRQGGTEVLVWGGANYRKAIAMTIVDRLTTNLKTAGWQYSVEGDGGGVTVFTAFKEGQTRRVLFGFYGATDDALIFSWMEVLPSGGATNQTADNPTEDRTENAPVRNAGGIVGTWTNGSVSMLSEKNLSTGAISSRGGSTFKYVFTADGRFEFIGLINSTMYGCTTSLFNDKRGRYEINGNQITLIPSKNFWRNTYSCSPASNKERDYVLERETLEFRTKTNEYGKQMICLNAGKGEGCYERAP
jgi:hypothetical protein